MGRQFRSPDLRIDEIVARMVCVATRPAMAADTYGLRRAPIARSVGHNVAVHILPPIKGLSRTRGKLPIHRVTDYVGACLIEELLHRRRINGVFA